MIPKVKLDILQKSAIILVGLVIITLFMWFFVKRATQYYDKQYGHVDQKVKEPMSGIAKEIFGPIVNAFDSVGNDIVKNVVQPVESGFKEVGNGILGVLKKPIDFIEKIFNFFIEYVIDLPEEIENWLTGIENHVMCGAAEAKDGFGYAFPVMGIMSRCALSKANTFFNGKCTFYYLVNIVLGICYLICIEFPIFLIFMLSGYDLNSIRLGIVNDILMPFDAFIYALVGIHIFRWSDKILDECFMCQGSLDGSTYNLTFSQWAEMLNCSLNEGTNGVVTILESVIPSEKWSAWFNGQHLAGSDNQPPFI